MKESYFWVHFTNGETCEADTRIRTFGPYKGVRLWGALVYGIHDEGCSILATSITSNMIHYWTLLDSTEERFTDIIIDANSNE